MLVVVWIALAVAVLSAAFGFVSAVRAGLRAWRDFSGFTRALASGLADLASRVERFAERAASTPAHAAELEAKRERLRVTLARFNVLRSAVDEATEAVGRITVFYPQK